MTKQIFNICQNEFIKKNRLTKYATDIVKILKKIPEPPKNIKLTTPEGDVKLLKISPDGNLLAITGNNTPFIELYKRSGNEKDII